MSICSLGTVGGLAAGAMLSAHAAVAQSVPDPITAGPLTIEPAQAAYLAITTTPLGTLPPSFAPSLVARAGLAPPKSQRAPVSLRAQFGHIDGKGGGFTVSRRIYGLTADLPFGASTLSVGGGYLDYSCGDLEKAFGEFGFGGNLRCKGGVVGGANWTAPLLSAPLGSAAALVVGIDGAAGFGTGDLIALSGGEFTEKVSATTWSAGLGLPVGLVARNGTLTLVPHLDPRVAYGHAKVRDEVSNPTLSILDVAVPEQSVAESGTRFMLGGGVSILLSGSPVGIDFGIQKVFVTDGTAMIGAALRYSIR